MKLSTEKNTIRLCPHCGHENDGGTNIGLGRMNTREPVFCSNCMKPIKNTQLPTFSGNKKIKARNSIVVFSIVAFLLLSLLIYLNWTFNAYSFKRDATQIIYVILLVLIISSGLASGKIWQKFKYLAIWMGIFLVLMIGYSYRYELAGIKNRVMAEFVPAKGFQQHPDSISFPLSSDGQFHIRAEINGTPIMFLVDTGASDIVLSPRDAKRLGINVKKLEFNQFYETANGMGLGSLIQISNLQIGKIHINEIAASVNKTQMRNSLLGMTFFKRLKGYAVKNDVLTLYWKSK